MTSRTSGIHSARGAAGRLRRNRWAFGSGIVLAIMYLGAFLAGFVAPYGVNETHYRDPEDMRYHPPVWPKVIDGNGDLHWPPFVYGTKRSADGATFEQDRSKVYSLRLFVEGDEYQVVGRHLRWNVHLFGVEAPGQIFLFGTDQFGRDVFSRVLYGARISLSVGLIGICLSMAIGMFVGAASGLAGGITDTFLMRLSEVAMSLPGLYLVVVLGGLLPSSLPSDTRYLLIVAILSLLGWAGLSRVVRGMVLSIRENDYVIAAKALGVGRARIMLRHVLPNTMSYVIVAATVSVPYYILGEVSLSFLGVGIKEPQASWGLMLSEAQSVTALTEYTWLLIPGLFIFLAVMCFNLLGDGLRDALDPKAPASRYSPGGA